MRTSNFIERQCVRQPTAEEGEECGECACVCMARAAADVHMMVEA